MDLPPPRDEKKVKKNDRKVIVILFLITIVLSLFFWLKKEIPAIWEKITAPYQMTIEKEEEKQ